MFDFSEEELRLVMEGAPSLKELILTRPLSVESDQVLNIRGRELRVLNIEQLQGVGELILEQENGEVIVVKGSESPRVSIKKPNQV